MAAGTKYTPFIYLLLSPKSNGDVDKLICNLSPTNSLRHMKHRWLVVASQLQDPDVVAHLGNRSDLVLPRRNCDFIILRFDENMKHKGPCDP